VGFRCNLSPEFYSELTASLRFLEEADGSTAAGRPAAGFNRVLGSDWRLRLVQFAFLMSTSLGPEFRREARAWAGGAGEDEADAGGMAMPASDDNLIGGLAEDARQLGSLFR